MTEIADGRSAAWINAWQCLEAAQKTRNEAFEAEQKLSGEQSSSHTDLFSSQRSTLYNALMHEAEVYSALASVPDAAVGMYAGTFIRDAADRKDEAQARAHEEIERILENRPKPKAEDV